MVVQRRDLSFFGGEGYARGHYFEFRRRYLVTLYQSTIKKEENEEHTKVCSLTQEPAPWAVSLEPGRHPIDGSFSHSVFPPSPSPAGLYAGKFADFDEGRFDSQVFDYHLPRPSRAPIPVGLSPQSTLMVRMDPTLAAMNQQKLLGL